MRISLGLKIARPPHKPRVNITENFIISYLPDFPSRNHDDLSEEMQIVSLPGFKESVEQVQREVLVCVH